jgi:hypothetical protein
MIGLGRIMVVEENRCIITSTHLREVRLYNRKQSWGITNEN